MNAIAILTIRPSTEIIDFYKKVIDKDHDVYIICDDSSVPNVNRHGITYIKLDEANCISQGFTRFTAGVKKNGEISKCSAWDKAIFYFSKINMAYEHIWFIEDDVFVPSHLYFKKTDSSFPNDDLLCQRHEINNSGNLHGWMWWKYIPSSILPAPWAISMVCAVRVSRRLLNEVADFAQENKDEFKFIEFIFNTLAMNKKLKIKVLDSLRGIVCRKNWTIEEMSVDCVYHPIKDLATRNQYRTYFDSLIN